MSTMKPLDSGVTEAQCGADADLEIRADAVRGGGQKVAAYCCLAHSIHRMRGLVAGDRGASDFHVRLVVGSTRKCGEQVTVESNGCPACNASHRGALDVAHGLPHVGCYYA